MYGEDANEFDDEARERRRIAQIKRDTFFSARMFMESMISAAAAKGEVLEPHTAAKAAIFYAKALMKEWEVIEKTTEFSGP